MRHAKRLSVGVFLVSTRAFAHMGPGIDMASVAWLAVIGVAVVSLVQGTLSWLVLRHWLDRSQRLWVRCWAYSFVLDAGAVLSLVADDRLQLDERWFASNGPPGLVRVLPVLMALSWLAWPLLEREARALRRLLVSQALLAATIGFFVLVMLLLGFNPFA